MIKKKYFNFDFMNPINSRFILTFNQSIIFYYLLQIIIIIITIFMNLFSESHFLLN